MEVKKEKKDSSDNESNRTRQSETVILGDQKEAPPAAVKEEALVDNLPLTSVAKGSEEEALG